MKARVSGLRTVVLALLALSIAGCGLSGSTDPGSEMDERQARWDEVRPFAYTFELHRTCPCPPDVERPTWIHVEGEEILEARDVGEGTSLPITGPRALSIDDIFGLLVEHLRKEGAWADMEFDPDYHYPRQVHGWIFDDIVGTEFNLAVVQFQPRF